MALYVLTTKTYGPDSVAAVMDAMETYMETIDDAKTIRLYKITSCSRDDQIIGVIVHDT